jgi:hypothetical protein
VNIWVIYGIIAAAGVLLIAGIVIGAVLLWRRQVRNSLIGLVSRREAIRAAYRALESVFATLAEDSADEVVEFATSPASVQRKALEELVGRMGMQTDELQNVALPKKFWHCADLLMAASVKLRDEVSAIHRAPTPDAVLAGVGRIDVAGIRAAIAAGGEELDRLLHDNRIEDPSVYGGGLYI